MKAYELKFILFVCIWLVSNQVIHIKSPQALVTTINNSQGIKIHISPLGNKHISGQLYVNLMLSEPISGCKIQKKVEDSQNGYPIFLLADDQQCLESVKGAKIAEVANGAIIQRNIDNTLNDREIKIVHIPILEIDPVYFELIKQTLLKNQTILAVIDFNRKNIISEDLVEIQVFFQTTDIKSYYFLIDLGIWLLGQPVHFTPRYALHSETQHKQYKKGCYSNGKYCPPNIQYVGTKEGENVMAEILRQIVIWNQYGNQSQKWWEYIRYFRSNCLQKAEDLMKVTGKAKICSQKVMILVGIDKQKINQEVMASFQGQQKRVDNNYLLQQQRQQYVMEQITSYPSVLINKVQYQLDLDKVKKRICDVHHSTKTNQKCLQLFSEDSTNYWYVGMGGCILALFMVFIAVGYKCYIKKQMQSQMKGQVAKTLEKYYKYMETYEKQDKKQGLMDGEKDGRNYIREDIMENSKRSEINNIKFQDTELQEIQRKKNEEQQ